MTHPDFRRKRLFTKLFDLAMQECRKRKFQKVLLLSDGKSDAGIGFIKSVGGKYEFSEYRMKTANQTSFVADQPISIREATVEDATNITKQNEVFFHFTEQWNLEEEKALNKPTYMIEKDKQVIGKISVACSDNQAFISGVGINPIERGKGYGTAALRETLRLLKERNIGVVELDVETKNDAALILYTACGFKEQSVMNYYQELIFCRIIGKIC
ncbi:MAG: GNAT family N-acetyltransferase [Bacillaceae bacterium]|nr:GNAT family N-acetyltransferase [Bacillaceae bacterium]